MVKLYEPTTYAIHNKATQLQACGQLIVVANKIIHKSAKRYDEK